MEIVERHLDGDTPYITIEVDLTSLRPGERFARRIRTAWVYPDATGQNHGLRRYAVRLRSLTVTDNQDEWDGEYHLWAAIPSSHRPWSRLMYCDGCMEEKTIEPGASEFLPNAMSANGTFGGDLDLFRGQRALLAFSGFEGDVVESDGLPQAEAVI